MRYFTPGVFTRFGLSKNKRIKKERGKMMERKKILYRPNGINNFHNSRVIGVLVSGVPVKTYAGELYPLSDRQSKRVKKHFCGISECRCPAGALIEYEEGKYGLPVEYII